MLARAPYSANARFRLRGTADGTATPVFGVNEEVLQIAENGLGRLGVGAVALDRLLADTKTPSVIQLWPEHFDVAVAVDVAAAASRVDLGAAPGGSYHAGPCLYVAPREAERPGDADCWNAPFGSTLGRDDLLRAPERIVAAIAFLRQGLDLLG